MQAGHFLRDIRAGVMLVTSEQRDACVPDGKLIFGSITPRPRTPRFQRQEISMTDDRSDDDTPTLASLRGTAKGSVTGDPVAAVRAVRDTNRESQEKAMTDEQRAAVERLRKDDYGKSEDFDYTDAGWMKRCCDEATVSDLYLAEHPADDGDDATPAWLAAVGASRDDIPAKWTFRRDDAMPIGLWHVDDGWKAMLIHHENAATCIVRGLKTRGDVRRLCSALGITLKEQEPKHD